MPFTPTTTQEIERAHGAPIHAIVRRRLAEGESMRQIAAELGYQSHSGLRYALAQQGWEVRAQKMLTRIEKREKKEPRHD